MADFFDDNDDLRFYVEQAIDWRSLVDLVEFDLRAEGAPASHAEAVEVYREVLHLVGSFAAREVAPRAAAIDRKGLELVAGELRVSSEWERIFARIRELELHGLALPRELGGIQCPLLVYFIAIELMARADVAVMSHYNFHGGMALAMLIYSIAEGTTSFDRERLAITATRWGQAIREIREGDAWGSMDITEAGAGSDMAALRTRGEQADDGTWTVTGEKIFITSGHGKYHFVIARTEPTAAGSDPLAGLAGLSLFLVPAWEEDGEGGRRMLARFERIEDKCGHHGSATVAISYDATPAHLVGRRGEGFRQMLLLMNNARIGVGFECLGLAEAALRAARAYAAERPSMGKTLERHELIADYLDEMGTDLQGIRALAMAAAVAEETHQRLRMQALLLHDAGAERDRLLARAKRQQERARALTPLLKYLAAEKAVEISRRSLQIHGGVGYTREFPVEKWVRDALVMPIYEGTSQMQALMAMKDVMAGIMKNPQGFLAKVAQARWRTLAARDGLARRVARLEVLSLSTQQLLLQRVAARKLRALDRRAPSTWSSELFKSWDPKRDFDFAKLHAERLTVILADVAICDLLLAQAFAHPERRLVLERYLERAEPRCRHLHACIATTGDRLLARLREGDHTDGDAAA